MGKKQHVKKQGFKQVRIVMPDEQYAKLNELKYKEKLIDTPIAEYAKSLLDIGFEAKVGEVL